MAYVSGHVRYLSSTDQRRKLYVSLIESGSMSGTVQVNAVTFKVWRTGKFESINLEDS